MVEVASFAIAYSVACRVAIHNNCCIISILNASSVNYSLKPYLTYASYLGLKDLPSGLGWPPLVDPNVVNAAFVNDSSVTYSFASPVDA